MLPFIAQESKRNINLGGTTSQSSQAAILDRARLLRNARRDDKKREDAALRIRRWLLSQRESQALRADLRAQFDTGPLAVSVEGAETDMRYVNWTRLLLLSGTDEARLSRWSSEIIDGGDHLLLGAFGGPYKESWLVLMRQIAFALLESVSRDPCSNQGLSHLKIVATLLSPPSWARAVPVATDASSGSHSNAIVNLASYLLKRDMFMYLARALEKTPTMSKADKQAAVYLTRMITSVFAIFNTSPPSMPYPINLENESVGRPHHVLTLSEFFKHILSVPILPNRIPLAEIPLLISRIPWADLPLTASTTVGGYIPTSMRDLASTFEKSKRPHVLANLLAFMPPRYAKLPALALKSYLELYSCLLDGIDIEQLEPHVKTTSGANTPEVKQAVVASDDDSDDENAMDIDGLPPSPAATSYLPGMMSAEPGMPLDTRTLSRLATLTTQPHFSALLSATSRHPTSRDQFFRFVLSLTATIPNKRDQIWTTISVSPGGGSGLVRECWRGYVRGSPLGKVEDGTAKALMDPALASSWPPLLFLVSLYTHSLLTVGDDEFFSLSSSSTTPRNPLTIDDLITFSRQLLHIAFPLYWLEDQSKVKQSGPEGVKFTWEKIRELVSNCLKGIHARDSRRPFTPPGHWLITSQLDLLSFVDAAVLEEHALSNEDSVLATTALARHRRSGMSPRQLAHISPRLGVLNNIPFAIPFEVRVEILRQFIRNDYARTFSPSGLPTMGIFGVRSAFEDAFGRTRRKRATVRRENISQDGFDQLSSIGAELKGPVEIQFVDKFGQEEAGIDGGGVFKEFLTSLSKEVFDTNRGLWLATKQQELYPNPHSYATEPHQLNWFRFIGRILGKALYEGILVDVTFASFFLAKWLGKQSYLDDLASLDPELYNGLIFLKNYDKNFEDLSLNFTISEDDLGVSRTVNLIPYGDQKSVTKENRLQYIYLVSHYRLSRQIKQQSEAFFEGLSDIIDPKWLRMFNQQEVQILVSGVNAPIDLDDLRQNCNYGGLYDDNEDTIRMFWKVVNAFDHEQRRGLLRFVTSCGRPPLLGFKELYPKFSIRDSSSDEQRLPTSSTCVNLLKLPRYQSERVMREKLLQAINSGAGFDLS